MNIFSYDFFQNALLGAFLSSIVCAIIGSYIVARRLVFLSGGITHASFAGIGISLFIGINPIFGALVSSILASIGINYLDRGSNRNDASIAAIWSLGMAIGILFTMLSPSYSSGISNYLFGNILLIDYIDLTLLFIYMIALFILIATNYKNILYSAFDRDFAITIGRKARFWNSLMLIMVSIALVLCIRLVGIMLLLSLLTLPQMTMNLFTSNFKKIIVGSAIISFLASFAGLLITANIDISTSASIIILLFVIYISSFILLKLK